GRLAVLARAVSRLWSVADFFQDFVAFDQFTETRVLPIEPRNRRETDEELRAGRIRIGHARHRDHAALMWVIVEFSFDFVAGSALSKAVLFRWIFRIRIAALNHESLDDAMKSCAVVKSRAGKFLKIFYCFRSGIGPKFDDHFAFVGFDHGHFA